MARKHEESARKLSKRTQNVWVAFFVTIATAMFVLQLGTDINQAGLMATLVSIEERPTEDPIFSSIEKADGDAWSSIVIHGLGYDGILEEIVRNSELKGLGHHFLIGNGYGIDDGFIHLSYRWLNQIPCAWETSADRSLWNSGVISICLVGNGNKRRFSEPQLVQLSLLVKRLQLGLSIPVEKILLANEIDNGSQSPGRYFAEAQFRSQLRDIPVPD